MTLLAGMLSLIVVIPVFSEEVQTASVVAPIEFTVTEMQSLFEQDAHPMQLASLSPTEMKETEGANLYLLALGIARVGIWAAPRISSAFRVINNVATRHTVLLQNNVHRMQIGVDRFGRHVGWGANTSNNAQYHIYQNDPWRINPRR